MLFRSSIGSVVAHELGARGEGVPAYVVMGYPSASRGPGFLGAKHGYIYLTETKSGPSGLQRPYDVSEPRQRRREHLLTRLQANYLKQNVGQQSVENYVATSVEGFKLAEIGRAHV